MPDGNISKRLQNSIIIYSALGVLTISIIVALVSIIPLFNHIKKDEDRNLLSAVKARTLAVEEYLSRAKDIALQITSRTRIRDYLDAYNKGEIGLNELVNFTAPKLVDAMNLAEEVDGISRLDHKGSLVVQVGLPIPEELWRVPDEKSGEVFINNPIALEGGSYLVVGAPILDGQSRRVGTDIILFRVTRLRQIVEDYTGLGETGETVLGVAHNSQVQLFFPLRGNRGEAPKSFPMSSPLGRAFEKAFHKETGILKSPDSPEVIAYGPIQNSKWGIVVKMKKRELYAPVNRQVVVIGGIIVVLISLSTFGMVVLLRPLAGRMIIHTDELQREIQEKTAALEAELGERKQTEEALRRIRDRLEQLVEERTTKLRESELVFQSLIDHAPFSIWICDGEGTIIFANQAALDLFGVTDPTQIVGRYNIYRDTTEAEKPLLAYFERAWAGEVVRYRQDLDMTTVKYDTARRETVHLFSTLFAIPSGSGRRSNIVVVQEDITERRRAEEELKKYREHLEEVVAERTAELEAFAYSVSHDLRAPLRAMQGFALALLEDYAERLDHIGRNYAQRIVAAAQRMDALIHDLLDYSRLSRSEMQLQPVNLQEVIDEVLKQLEAEIQEREAQVSVEEPLPQVMGHYATLLQAMENLLTNAVKFVASGVQPQVRVWAEEHSRWVRLWVEDNGIGIAPEHRERIFRVFERLHGVETYPGTGIGLAIVRKGIERMGGRVGVESAPGQGSRFWVELPKA
jgi:PAS domain S-box-containing protein